tara:strand:+ start:915 stop:1544 length:630 start_codon:yes stop_codon:yes gene_type:complete
MIIGINGSIGSGKDFFAETLAEFSSAPVERHAFADKLRLIAEELTGYEMKMTHEANKPFYNAVYNFTQDDKNVYLDMWGKTVGQILQELGTDALRDNFDSDVWVKSLFSSVGEDTLKRGNILVIPDVRFPNEAEYVLKKGGILIKIVGDPMGVKANSKRDLNHPSETSLNDYQNFTDIIENDVADVNYFQEKVRRFMFKRGVPIVPSYA